MQQKHALAWTLTLFAALWTIFYGLYRAFPYVKNGSDIVFGAKLRYEHEGPIFPLDTQKKRLLIFGNSKILAGFLPSRFDELSGVRSFNSGFPGSDLFLPPLKDLCARGQAPNILLLTLPWNNDPPRPGIFRFIQDDHAVIDFLFPFRNFARDLTAFLLAAPSQGGVVAYYRQSEENERAVIAERGYHLITEQSRFPGGRLPDDFHLASDQPAVVFKRTPPIDSKQAEELDQLLQQYHIRCYYVPFYLREGEAAPSAYDREFAAALEKASTCQLLGPDYFLYPSRYFADQTHLNKDGALLYTEALFNLLKGAHAL